MNIRDGTDLIGGHDRSNISADDNPKQCVPRFQYLKESDGFHQSPAFGFQPRHQNLGASSLGGLVLDMRVGKG